MSPSRFPPSGVNIKSLHVTCPDCGAALTVKMPYLADKYTSCRKCGGGIVVMWDTDGVFVRYLCDKPADGSKVDTRELSYVRRGSDVTC